MNDDNVATVTVEYISIVFTYRLCLNRFPLRIFETACFCHQYWDH